jgi:hypothetical protein
MTGLVLEPLEDAVGRLDPAPWTAGASDTLAEAWTVAWRAARNTDLTTSRQRLFANAYDPIVADLRARGFRDVQNPYRGRPWLPDVAPEQQQAAAEARVWMAIRRARLRDGTALATLPRDQQAFTEQVRAAARASLDDAADPARSAMGFWTQATAFTAAMAADMTDPLNLALSVLPLGAARSIASAAVREGAVNAGAEALSLPEVAAWRAELGAPLSAAEMAGQVAGAAAFGAVVGGGVKALEQGVGALRRRLAGRAPALSDQTLATAARAVTPEPSPELEAALAVLEEDARLQAQTPFVRDDPEADAEHRARLDQATAQLLTEQPVRLPPATVPVAPDALDAQASGLQRFRPDDLEVDAARFQFKAGGDAFGVTERLAGVTRWNPILSGKAIVWRDEEGRSFIVDGHQRLALAQRIQAADPTQDIWIDAVLLNAADGVSAADARTWAALKNIAEGTGSAIDAAKVFREIGDAAAIPLPPRSTLVRDGRALAALSDDAFGMVVNEAVPAEFAALVGRLAADRPALHASLLSVLARTSPATRVQAESIVRQALAAGETTAVQIDLFGETALAQSLYQQKAKVLDSALRTLKTDRRVFATLVDDAARIEGAGNQLARDANQQRVIDNATALDILLRLAHSRGPVSDALNGAARRYADTGQLGPAARAFLDQLRGLDLRSLAREGAVRDRDGLVAGGTGRGGGAGETDGGVGGLADAPDGARDIVADPDTDSASDSGGDLFGLTDAAHAAPVLETFDDPHGVAADTQAAILRHELAAAISDIGAGGDPRKPALFALDERLVDGGAVANTRSAADILSDIDGDKAALQAIRECLL